jgi:hypothetical protein
MPPTNSPAANAVFVFFTFHGDAACLKQAVRSVRKFMSEAAVVVFDDGDNPLPERDAQTLSVDHYETTHFNRWKNLNGRECVMGELLCFLRAIEVTGRDHIVKVDSDTLILGPGMLLHDADMVGHCWGRSFVYGPCYTVRGRKMVFDMLMQTRTARGLRVEEDAAMTQLCRLAGGTVMFQDREHDPTARHLGVFSYEFRKPITYYRTYAALTFGIRHELPDDDLVLKRVGLAMRLFLDTIIENARPDIILDVLDDDKLAWEDEQLHKESRLKVEIGCPGDARSSYPDVDCGCRLLRPWKRAVRWMTHHLAKF